MFLNRLLSHVGLVLVTCAGLGLSGCGSDDNGAQTPDTEQPDTTPPGGDNDDGGEDLTGQPASAKSRVKRKSPATLQTDLAQVLSLDKAELCSELGLADCFDVHNILLGGVEPYRLRIDDPIASPSLATPSAVDRIVLSACGERAARDLADPKSAVIFATGGETDAAALDPEARKQSAETLYRRVLSRTAREAELSALVDFYDEVAAEMVAEDVAQTWAQLACYSVATTSEFLFY